MLGLLTVHSALLAWGAFRQSPTFDETAHLPSGLSHWEFRRFDLYAVNPPLIRMVAATPVLFSNAVRDWSNYTDDHGYRQEFAVGRDFLRMNGDRAYWYFTLARWACIPFSILGAVICARWAHVLYGEWAGVGAMTLWCFSPTILGHGQLITPDVGAAATAIAASYSFWRFMSDPRPRTVLFAGALTGVAWLSKTTLLVLGVAWVLQWCYCRVMRRRADAPVASLLELLSVFVIAIVIVNTGYCFEGTFTRLGDIDFVSRLGVTADGDSRFAKCWMREVPVPFPVNYVRGIDRQKADFEAGWDSYLRGKWRNHGWWYYYLYGLAVKMPIGSLVLLAFACLGTPFRRPVTSQESFLILPAAMVLVLVSSQTGFNHHVRYVLPTLPFIFVFSCRTLSRNRLCSRSNRNAAPPSWISRMRRTLIISAFSASVVSSLSVYPHTLSYFNEFVGGPRRGHLHLLNSNIDWGQDLLYLRDWIERHPNAQPLHLAYFPSWQAGALVERLPVTQLKAGDSITVPGWYAVSVNELFGQRPELDPLRRLKPTSRIGYTILVFHISDLPDRDADG